tara:strand:- start:8144 stop:8326 length:183 start_codon:yes stop_codon:yes gene_type:complete
MKYKKVDANRPFVPREKKFDYNTRVALGVQNDHQDKSMTVTLPKFPWEKKDDIQIKQTKP